MAELPQTNATAPRVKFHFIKSNAFRVVHVNGFVGGWNGVGELHIAAYSERPAIPLVVEHEVLADTLGPAKTVEGKTGFVRELEVDLMLNRDRAVELRDWLNQRLAEFDQMTQGAKK